MFASTRTLDRTATSVAIDVILILLFANLTAVAARIAVYLPFSPVPITAQTLLVLLAGAALGPRRGAASQVAYIAEGVAGLPVFAGGNAGLAVLLGPTGGYLIGFVACAALVGWLGERRGLRSPLATFIVMLLGSALIYPFGAVWLSRVVPGGLSVAIAQGVLPFLPGDALKSAIAAGVVPSARWTIVRWRGD
ncbi:MAG TPA: biotin transporter BioY [Chloroflexota bacterium]|nr:biotin transporter BioY [Chloroflexota bacterium]